MEDLIKLDYQEKGLKYDDYVKSPAIDIREFILDNGLQVVMSKHDKIPMVVINTAYKVGSKDDDPDKTGLAHLFEHLLFEGTANTSRGEFDELLQVRGGESNAYTSNDITSYYMVLPAHQLEFGFWLDSDRMAGFGIDKKSLSVQKKVVHEEKLMLFDNAPCGSVEEQSLSRLFKNCSYRWPVIGDTFRLQNVSLEEVETFFNNYYVPVNAVLTIVGDIDYQRTRDLVHKYYSGLNPTPKPRRHDFGNVSQIDFEKITVEDNINLPSDFIFYLTPGIGEKAQYAGELLSVILSDGESSVLHNELVYKEKLLNEVDSGNHALEKAGVFSLSFSGRKNRSLQRALEKFDVLLHKFNNGDFDARVLEKAKNKIETGFNRRKSSILSVADYITSYKVFFDDADKVNTSVYEYMIVTKEDIINFVREYMNEDKRIILSYVPKT